MKPVSIKVKRRGSNTSVKDLILNKVYPAVRYEPGEEDERGHPGDDVYYIVYDDVGDRCGIYRGYEGVVIEEVQDGPTLA